MLRQRRGGWRYDDDAGVADAWPLADMTWANRASLAVLTITSLSSPRGGSQGLSHLGVTSQNPA